MTRVQRLSLALAAALAGAALALACPAQAGTVMLRAQVSASGAITLGDLFEGAGAAAPIVVGTGAPAGMSAVLDAAIVQRIAHDHGLDWTVPAGLQRIIVPSAGAVRASATTVDALTFARDLNAGVIVQPSDIAYGKVPSFQAPPDAPRDATEVIGKTTRMPVRAGSAVSSNELRNSLMIKRDDMVEVAYHNEGITLVLQGRATADAAAGEPVGIENTTSKKVIQAIATGPDQAVVGPEADAIRANTSLAPSQFAALP